MRIGITVMVWAAATTAVFGQPRVDVPFSIQYQTVVGQSVYVVGDLPELGANDVRRAVKLEPSAYPLWRATISLPTNRSYSYRFIWRNDSAAQVASLSNATTISGPFVVSTAADQAPPPGKLIAYHSGWTAPVLNWRQGNGTFVTEPMSFVSEARGPGESRWVARLDRLRTGVITGAPIEFFITDPATAGRDPFSGSYVTALDAVLLQDGQQFTSIPAPQVSPAQRAYNPASPPTRPSIATNLGGSRAYRVFLPRGYAQHSLPPFNKRYPVLYMHDGQNVFEQGAFGTWNAATTISNLQNSAQMREIIVVAIDNGPNRLNEYAAPDGGPGIGDRYTRFIRDELKPFIDTTYRTIPTADVTGVAGSSMGGQISLYQGWDFASTFTRIGAFSGAWNVAGSINNVAVFNTAFYDRVRNQLTRPQLRLYLDSGDSGTANDNFSLTMSLRDNLIARASGAYTLERQLDHVVGLAQQHNEAAWAARLPAALIYLYPATEEPNHQLMALWRTRGVVPPAAGDALVPGAGQSFDHVGPDRR